MSKRKKPRRLVVKFDVTGLGANQIAALQADVTAQAEASDGHGGGRYEGKTGHPDVPVLGAKVVAGSKEIVQLVVEYDVSGLTKIEIGYLASEAEVQAEASEEHPDVAVVSKIV